MSDVASIGRNSSCRSPVVIPSSQLDSNLHEKAAQITKKKHQESQASDAGSHDDDPMTPPEVLLEQVLKRAKHLTADMGEAGEDVTDVLDVHIRCTALSRIVYGDSHWILAKAHIQLAKAYLELKGVLQAMHHATKGRDILLAPGAISKSRDLPFEVTSQLALSHCILGQVHTLQGELSKGEQELVKAKKAFSRAKQDGDTDVEVELDILTALAKLHLKQEKFENSRDKFAQSVGLTKSRFGADSTKHIPLLRGKATAEAHLGLHETAGQTLQDALEIAEAKCGEESEVVGEVVQAQARLGTARLRAGGQVEPKSVDDTFSRAFSIFSCVLGEHSEKALQCKEEWSLMLASQSESKERAIPLLKELLEAKKRTHGELSAQVGHTLKMLGSLQLSMGRANQAIDYLHQAEVAYKCSLGATHRETAAVTKALQTISGSCEGSRQGNQTKPLFKTVF